MKTTLRFPAFILALALLLGTLDGCHITADEITPTPSASPSPPAETTAPPTTSTPPVTSAPQPVTGVMFTNFRPGFNAGDAYLPMLLDPQVKDYTLNPDLSNVTNLDRFPDLTAAQRAAIAQNGFVVTPGGREQLFYVYEENQYNKIPSFITTDSVLQVYHIFYDYTLRTLETESLMSDADWLVGAMLRQLIADYNVITDPTVKQQALLCVGYFGTAQLAFGQGLPPDFPAEITEIVQNEETLMYAAAGVSESPLFGVDMDYSQFTPRGHYTRSVELEHYFRGMMWFGFVPFALSSVNEADALRAILITTALCRLPADEGGQLWENIYSPTAFFVGEADDVTPWQLAQVIQTVYGDEPDLNTLADSDKLAAFFAECNKQLPLPQIVKDNADPEQNRQFRFMGQRYIPDSEILQRLSNWPDRPFPQGLDVFSALSSDRANALIEKYENPAAKWLDYPTELNKVRGDFAAKPGEIWRSNMYYGWLWTQTSLTATYGAGWPMFMRSTAWRDKSLATALGSWSEMRHDTILYAKQSMAENGDGYEPDKPPAYVEPNAETYNRLLWLTAFSRENLDARGILPDGVRNVCERFEELLTFLRDCAIKELNGKDLSGDDNDRLWEYGGWLEYLSTAIVNDNGGGGWYLVESETDRNMALIADVHTSNGSYLEAGVGPAAVIYAAVPVGGQVVLARGAVFDYYEFVSDTRLTDEAWQAMLTANPPARPVWTGSFLVED